METSLVTRLTGADIFGRLMQGISKKETGLAK